MEFSDSLIQQTLAQYLFPFARISTLLMTMALIGTRLVPMRVRLILALATTACVAPLLPPMPEVEMVSVGAYLILIQQILIGAVMGLITQLVLQAFVLGGNIMAMQAGLGFAQMMDPANGVSVPIISQFFLMLASLLFLSLDGHLVMIKLIVVSFQTLPVGPIGFSADQWLQLANWGHWMFVAGVLMAMAAIIALLLVNIAFGIMTKAAPQLNIFAVGFPVTVTAGLLIAWLAIDGMLPHFEGLWQQSLDLMCELTLNPC